MRKIILQFILSLIPILTFADTHKKDTIFYKNFAFEMDLDAKTAKTLEIQIWSYNDDLVIPGEIPYEGETFKVTCIGKRTFQDYDNIKSVIIPNTVTYIGEDAFRRCRALTSITWSNSLETIGESAFRECTSLTSVEIPSSTIKIQDFAFEDCSNLTSVTTADGLIAIGDYSFYRCAKLTSINISNSVESIGKYAFYQCSGLSSIVIPNSMLSIGRGAFESCSSLTSLTIPNSVTYIGECITLGDNSITSIIVEEGNANYDSRNNCNAIIETATNKLIAGCNNTIIPDGVTTLGWYCLGCLTEFNKIDIPNTVSIIENGVFYGTSLTSVKLPDSLTSIALSVFEECNGLTEITIPELVTYVGYRAFYSSNLKQVVSLIKDPSIYSIDIDHDAFNSYTYSSGTLYVPEGTLSEYKKSYPWYKFKNIKEGSPSAISSVSLDEQTSESGRYTLDGKKLSEPQKGLNIIRYKDGSVKKKLMK